MISRDELRSLKAKLLTYCSENDLFDDYNVEGIFDIVAERFMTSDFETLEKEINEVIPKRKFQKFKNMTYNNRIIKDLEDIKEYNELLKRYEFISFISYYLRDNLGDEWITRRVNAMFPEYLLNDLQQVLVRSVEHYKKDKKRKEILSKTGKVIGTIAFSPFLLLGAIAKYSFALIDSRFSKGVFASILISKTFFTSALSNSDCSSSKCVPLLRTRQLSCSFIASSFSVILSILYLFQSLFLLR